MGIRGLTLAVLAAAVIGVPAHAADMAGARAFVTWLYSHYPASGRVHDFDSLGPSIAKVFDPSLIALIREDQRLANGEVGALDGDPVCDCQDDAGSTFTVRSLRAMDSTRVVAIVARGPDETGQGAEDIGLDLAFAAGRWRIYDIHSNDTPSLRAYLIKSNREARARK